MKPINLPFGTRRKTVIIPDSAVVGFPIAGLEIECTLKETYTHKNTVTRFPVEAGAAITDHSIIEPSAFTIEAFVSDTPPKLLAIFRDYMSAQDVYDALLALRKSGQTFTLQMGFQEVDGVLLDSLSVNREQRTQRALAFNLVCHQVTFADSLTALLARAPKPKAKTSKPKVDKGKQKTEPVPEGSARQKTWAAGGADALIGGVKALLGAP